MDRASTAPAAQGKLRHHKAVSMQCSSTTYAGAFRCLAVEQEKLDSANSLGSEIGFSCANPHLPRELKLSLACLHF